MDLIQNQLFLYITNENVKNGIQIWKFNFGCLSKLFEIISNSTFFCRIIFPIAILIAQTCSYNRARHNEKGPSPFPRTSSHPNGTDRRCIKDESYVYEK